MQRALLVVVVLAACSDGNDGLGALKPRLRATATELAVMETFVGHPRVVTLALINEGDAVTTLRGFAFTGDFALGEGAPAAVPAGGRVDLPIVFAPASAGLRSGAITVASDAVDQPSLTVALRGTGLAAPACADANPCTDERFDPDTGRCTVTFNAGACDDGDPCTGPDVCESGGCSGRSFACDDGNPCTTDTCDGAGGCDHDDLPDGTACGPGEQCVRANVCIFGSCGEHDVPEGFPCQDADPCTTDEACESQRCVPGRRVVSAPEVTGFAPMFGAYVDAVTALPDGRLVVLDLASGQHALRTVFRLGDRLTLARTTTIGFSRNEAPQALIPLGDHRVIVDLGEHAYLFDVDTGAISPFGGFAIGYRAFATLGDTIFRYGEWTVDAFHLDGAVGAQWTHAYPIERRGCFAIAADPLRGRVYTVDPDGIRVFDGSATATVARTLAVLPSPFDGTVAVRVLASERALVAIDYAGRAVIYDPDTLQPASELQLDCTVVAGNAGQYCLGELFGATLIHGRRDPDGRLMLMATDLTRPAQPMTLAEEPADNASGVVNAVGGVVFTGLGVAYVVAPGTRDPIRRVWGPELGYPLTVFAPRTVVTLGGVHGLDVTNPRRPVLTGGLPPPGGGRPFYRSATRRFASALALTTTVTLVDLTVPDAPRALGAVTEYPGTESCLAPSGRKMMGRPREDAPMGLYDLAALTPGRLTPYAVLPPSTRVRATPWFAPFCAWNEASGDLLVGDRFGGLAHLDVRTSSAPRVGTFALPDFGDRIVAHPRGRGFVLTTMPPEGGCDLVTVDRDASGELRVVAQEHLEARCWNSVALPTGAIYLVDASYGQLTAVVPGTSYQQTFRGPYDITHLTQADDALLFTTPYGVGVMTPACPPPP